MSHTCTNMCDDYAHEEVISMKYWVLLGILILIIALAAWNDATTLQVCYEDMACWDCTTMGNRICGP